MFKSFANYIGQWILEFFVGCIIIVPAYFYAAQNVDNGIYRLMIIFGFWLVLELYTFIVSKRVTNRTISVVKRSQVNTVPSVDYTLLPSRSWNQDTSIPENVNIDGVPYYDEYHPPKGDHGTSVTEFPK